jgi:hypothetical protein
MRQAPEYTSTNGPACAPAPAPRCVRHTAAAGAPCGAGARLPRLWEERARPLQVSAMSAARRSCRALVLAEPGAVPPVLLPGLHLQAGKRAGWVGGWEGGGQVEGRRLRARYLAQHPCLSQRSGLHSVAHRAVPAAAAAAAARCASGGGSAAGAAAAEAQLPNRRVRGGVSGRAGARHPPSRRGTCWSRRACRTGSARPPRSARRRTCGPRVGPRVRPRCSASPASGAGWRRLAQAGAGWRQSAAAAARPTCSTRYSG